MSTRSPTGLSIRLVLSVLLTTTASACEQPREIEITWQNDTGQTIAYYPVRRGIDELEGIVRGIKRNVYELGERWRDDIDVGDGVPPWCPRGDVSYDFHFVALRPGTPVVDGRIDNERVTLDDLEVIAVVEVDESFCFPDRTGNEFIVAADR